MSGRYCNQSYPSCRVFSACNHLSGTRSHEEASVALGKVLYLDQDFILAHHALADIYKQLGKPEESGRHLAIALQLLDARNRDEIVPESDGMTCGRLIESVRAMKEV